MVFLKTVVEPDSCSCAIRGYGWFAVVALAIASATASAQHQLYLDFGPTAGFPEYSSRSELGIYTSPIVRFDASSLDASFTSIDTQSIIDRVVQIVREDYRDFDLQVSTAPPPFGTYQHIGIDHTVASYYMEMYDDWNYLFGVAQGIDDQADDEDYGRVWAGTFGAWDAAWQGANSTVERWARTIGETAAHEAGHNYGLRHPDYYADPNHIMTTDRDISAEQRATLDRYWKSTNYSHLMGVLGPRAPMSCVMAFDNPAADKIHEMRVRFHSQHDIVDLEPISAGGGFGPMPFADLKIVALGKDASFRDGSWHQYELQWTDGAGVESGQSGRLPAGFGQASDFVFDSVVAYDGQGEPLDAVLPMISCGAGSVGPNGALTIPMANPGQADLLLDNLQLRAMPYMLDLVSMSPQYLDEFLTTFGVLVKASDQQAANGPILLEAGKSIDFGIGNYDAWEQQARAAFDVGSGMLEDDLLLNLPHGTVPPDFYAMFPDAYLYLSCDVILPDQMLWDPLAGQYVEGNLVTTMHVQMSGQAVKLAIPEPGSALWVGLIVPLVWRRRTAACGDRLGIG